MNRPIKQTLTLLILLISTFTIYAQQRPHFSHEEFKQKQKEFITRQAELTPEEIETFFPLFFALQHEKWQINDSARKKVIRERGQRLTEEESSQLVNELADAKIKIAQLEKSYISKYLEILPAKKILDINRAEERFQREMLKSMTSGQKGKMNGTGKHYKESK